MDKSVEYEKGKYYRKDTLFSEREGEYFQVVDIRHPDTQYPDHTVYDLFQITYRKFDACRVNWGEEPAKYIFGPSRFWNARKSSTLCHLSEGGYEEVTAEEFEAVRNELLKEMSEIDSVPGTLTEDPYLWWGEKQYMKKLDTPTFSEYVPSTQSFRDVPETFELKFGEWGTDVCGVYLHRGYSHGEHNPEGDVPLDEGLFKQRRDALMQMVRENIRGFYDFVQNPYREKSSEAHLS